MYIRMKVETTRKYDLGVISFRKYTYFLLNSVHQFWSGGTLFLQFFFLSWGCARTLHMAGYTLGIVLPYWFFHTSDVLEAEISFSDPKTILLVTILFLTPPNHWPSCVFYRHHQHCKVCFQLVCVCVELLHSTHCLCAISVKWDSWPLIVLTSQGYISYYCINRLKMQRNNIVFYSAGFNFSMTNHHSFLCHSFNNMKVMYSPCHILILKD
jgi:hypothetical protein